MNSDSLHRDQSNGDIFSQSPTQKKQDLLHPVITIYLILYNTLNMMMWSVTAACIAKHFISGGKVSTLYDTISTSLYIAQTLALLEVIHSLLGIVRSPFVTSLMQVSSRILLIYGIIWQVPSARRYWGFTLMTVSWCIAEIPRYFFYVYTLLVQQHYGHDKSSSYELPYIIKYIRYSLFLVLYPTGITGELLEIIHSLPYIYQHQILSIKMPNSWNIAISYYYVLIGIILFYIPGSYIMYTHMLKARNKTLSLGSHKQLKTQ